MTTSNENAGTKRWLVPVVCAATLLIPVLVWLISTQDPVAYFVREVPPGQRFYIISKLLGLLALTLFWLQCMAALARWAPALRGFLDLSRRQHAWIGGMTFALVVTHVVLFIAASTQRTGHLALPLLVPKFNQGFYISFVSVGAIAFWILIVVITAGVLRSRGHAGWHWIHRASSRGGAYRDPSGRSATWDRSGHWDVDDGKGGTRKRYDRWGNPTDLHKPPNPKAPAQKPILKWGKKACKALGPLGILGTIGIQMAADEPINPGDLACDAMWGCSDLH